MAVRNVAHIVSGVVTNVTVQDTDNPITPPAGTTFVDVVGTVSAGDGYSGGRFTAASVVTPSATLKDKLMGGTDLTLAEINNLLRED